MTELVAVPGLPVEEPSREMFPKVGVFLLLFSLTLLGLLLLSRAYLLPRVAEVEVNGVRRSLSDLSAYQTQLLANVESDEKERDALVIPSFDPTFESLKQQRRDQIAFPWLLEELRGTAQALVAEDDAIHISSLSLDPATKHVELAGDVRNVGKRSMTVLASFVTELGRLPYVSSVSEPTYERLDDEVLGSHSPFVISLDLQ